MLAVASDTPQWTKKLSGRMTVAGTLFEAWRIGPLQTEWRSENGRASIRRNWRSETCSLRIDGVVIPGSNPAKAKRFRDLIPAMMAAVALMEK